MRQCRFHRLGALHIDAGGAKGVKRVLIQAIIIRRLVEIRFGDAVPLAVGREEA